MGLSNVLWTILQSHCPIPTFLHKMCSCCSNLQELVKTISSPVGLQQIRVLAPVATEVMGKENSGN